MQKGTYLYKAMAKHRRKFLIVNCVLLALLTWFTVAKLPYLKAEIFGPKPLDMDRFLSETDTFKIDELIELDRHDNANPESSYFRQTSYWQDDVYLFDIKTDEMEKTDISFVNVLDYADSSVEIPLADIWYAKSGGRNFVVIGKPGKEYTGTISGYIVKPTVAITSEISKTLENGEEIVLSEYFIDCRDTEMGTSDTDWTFVKIMLVILILLFAKLVLYYIKPEYAPTYRQLKRIGNIKDVADEINRQAEADDAYIEDKKLITKDFILSDMFFKKKVVRNHMSKN